MWLLPAHFLQNSEGKIWTNLENGEFMTASIAAFRGSVLMELKVDSVEFQMTGCLISCTVKFLLPGKNER